MHNCRYNPDKLLYPTVETGHAPSFLIMATISEIYEIEQGRESYDLIHLFAEGSFWRAYEYSAWLFTRSIHEFKVTKRLMKGIEDPVTFPHHYRYQDNLALKSH